MPHNGLICEECYTEHSMSEIRHASAEAAAGIACPNCGNASFGI
ncbi:hypothetical protein [Natronomonas sp.]|nr:hypothetical protein [Natronomonas sp.]